MVQSELFASSWVMAIALWIRLAAGTWPQDPYLIGLSISAVLTSLWNHGSTNVVALWFDRVIVSLLGLYILVPCVIAGSFTLTQCLLWISVLCFFWSKLNAHDEDLRVRAHKNSHYWAAAGALSL